MTKNKVSIPVRTGEIDFKDFYAGLKATVCTNPLYKTKNDLTSGDDEKFRAALKVIVLDWNFALPNGDEIPAGEPDDVPDDLLALLLTEWRKKVDDASKLPKA